MNPEGLGFFQLAGGQAQLLDLVAGAPSVTDFPVSPSSSAGAQFQALLPDGAAVVLADTAGLALADPNSPFAGVALSAFVAGGSVQILTQGPLEGFTLGPGLACAVGVDVAGSLVRVTTAASKAGLRYVGTCDTSGAVFVQPLIAEAADVRYYGGKADADGHGAGSDLGAVLNNMISLGLVDIFIPPGQAPTAWRIASTVEISAGVVQIRGAGNGAFTAPTQLFTDETVTAFALDYPNAQGSQFKNFWVGQVAKNLNATTGAWTQVTREVDVAAVGDFAVGQVIRLRGVGGQNPLAYVTGSTIGVGTDQVSVTETFGGGLKIGMCIILGAAFPVATQILNIVGTTLTMATVAAAPAVDVQVQYCFDLVARITGIAGTILTLDNNASHVGSGVIPATASNVPVEHADTAFYSTVALDIQNVDVGGGPINGIMGFRGFAFTIAGQTDAIPPQNADLANVSICYALHCAGAIYTCGDAANVCRFIGISASGSDDWSFVEAAFLGNTYVGCHADGGSGFVTTFALANASAFVGCYMEGGTSSSFGQGCVILGGTMAPDAGGTSIVQSLTNQISFESNDHSIVAQTKLASFPDPGALNQFGAYTAWVTPDGFVWSWTIPQAGEFGFTHWQGVRVANGTRSMALLFPEPGQPEFRDGGPPGWFPGGIFVGGLHPSNGTKADKRLIYADVGPPGAATGFTYHQGDRINNIAPTELGAPGSKYVLDHWICVADGDPGTWLEARTLTGN